MESRAGDFASLHGGGKMLMVRKNNLAMLLASTLFALHSSQLGCASGRTPVQGRSTQGDSGVSKEASTKISEAEDEQEKIFEVSCKPTFVTSRKFFSYHQVDLTTGDSLGDKHVDLVSLLLTKGTEEIYVVWKGADGPDPVHLDKNREYMFVLEPKIVLGRQAYKVVRILDNKTIIFENQGELPAFPVPPRARLIRDYDK